MVVLHGLGTARRVFAGCRKALNLPWLIICWSMRRMNIMEGILGMILLETQRKEVRRSREMLQQLLDAQRAKGFPTETTVLFGFSQDA